MQGLAHAHARSRTRSDKNIVYLYVSGSQGARPETELAGCKNGRSGRPDELAVSGSTSSRCRSRSPQDAAVVTGARIFTGTDAGAAPTRRGRAATRARACRHAAAGQRDSMARLAEQPARATATT